MVVSICLRQKKMSERANNKRKMRLKTVRSISKLNQFICAGVQFKVKSKYSNTPRLILKLILLKICSLLKISSFSFHLPLLGMAKSLEIGYQSILLLDWVSETAFAANQKIFWRPIRTLSV